MRLTSYKYRLKPTPEQEVLLNKHFGCVRFLYNHFLEFCTNKYQNEQKTVNYYENSASIPKLKKKFEWLKEVNAQSLQYSAKQLQNAYDNFFRKIKQNVKGKKGHPCFKHKTGKQSFRVKQTIKIEGNKVSFTKFKEGIHVLLHRQIKGEIKFATISKNKAGEYYISITTKRDIEKPEPTEKTIGLDLNVHGIVCSDSTK